MDIEAEKKHNYVSLSDELDVIMTLNQAMNRNLVSLATVMLSLAVALSDKLQSNSPVHPWLLQASMGLLAVTILSGLIVSYGEIQLHKKRKDLAIQNLQTLHSSRDPADPKLAAVFRPQFFGISPVFHYAHVCTRGAFSLATLALSAFGIANI